MDLASRLDQFRQDNPYDIQTQAKRLLAGGDNDLIIYILALGLTTAAHRQRHTERTYIKNFGQAPPKEHLSPIKVIPAKLNKRMQDATEQLIINVWHVGSKQLGDCNKIDLAKAIERENKSANGHNLNAMFYSNIMAPMKPLINVRLQWKEEAIRSEIQKVYGEFRKEAA